jgi:hypothetical protein
VKLLSRLSVNKNQCRFLFFFLGPISGMTTLGRHRAGLKEVQILNRLKQADPDDKRHLVRLERTFEHRGHLCLVFESLRFILFSSLIIYDMLIMY